MSTNLHQHSRNQAISTPSRGAGATASQGASLSVRFDRRGALYAAVIFLSAFLLFQVQFLIAKYILPWFGGTSAVWITCLFFFQSLLLAGYGYSHATGRLAPAARFHLHGALLLLSLGMLGLAGWAWPTPITPSAPLLWSNAPAASVLGTLLISVGLPFWLLSTTSPLLQDWYARSGATPFRLYALSNLGSLAGLLSYPFLVEPLLTLRQQAWMWCIGFVLFAAGSIACGFGAQVAAATATPVPAHAAPPARTSAGILFFWLALPAASSALLLGTTNYLTQDVASVPLLWVMPLAVYLASFVLSFAGERAVPRWVLWPAFAITLAMACDALFRSGFITVRREIWVHGAVLFFGCMICHSELARLKPEPRLLTSFYLCIATGSALGSALVALGAPRVLPDVWEFQVALAAIVLLGILVMVRDADSWTRRAPPWQIAAASAIIGIVPMLALLTPLRQGAPWLWYALSGSCAVLLLAASVLYGRKSIAQTWGRHAASGSLFVPAVAVALVLIVSMRSASGTVLTRVRNFYGVIRVVEQSRNDPIRHSYELYHGRILHGLQLRNPELRRRATSYYNNVSGVALALRFHPRRWTSDPGQYNIRFGIVGMGTGTALIYAVPGDYARVYELNPAVDALSRGSDPYFSYLRDSRGATDVVLGDGRISLQQEADRGALQNFDVILLDAFNGDAIPMHLLTREAMQLYLRHLRDSNGIIAVNITNKVVDLAPVLARLSQELNLEGVRVKAQAQGYYIQENEWVLLSPGTNPLRTPPLGTQVKMDDLGRTGPLWTDDFSNLFTVLK